MASSAVSGPAGYLARHRLRLALLVALVEGFLVVLGVLPDWTVYVLAAVAVGFWAIAGRTYTSATVRHASWIFAASQTLVVLVPLLLHFVKAVAYVVLAVLAVLALVILFSDRGDVRG